MWKVILINGKEINSYDCNWVELPNIPIKILEFGFYNKKLILKGFESYLYLKELYQFMNKESILDTVNILAKYNNFVYQFSINVRKGYVTQSKNVWGKEFKPLQWNFKSKCFEFGIARPTNRNLWHYGENTVPEVKLIK